MALKNREDTTLRFLNLVNDTIVTDQDFPQVVITDLGNSTPGERLLRCSLRAGPETLDPAARSAAFVADDVATDLDKIPARKNSYRFCSVAEASSTSFAF
jgi:hypothetical protein